MKAFNAGNFKDAYDGLRKLALDPNDDPAKVGQDLTTAIICLQRLGRIDEVDDFREAVIKVHKSNWRLLADGGAELCQRQWSITASSSPASSIAATIAAAAAIVNTLERDRARALQLMQQALTLTDKRERQGRRLATLPSAIRRICSSTAAASTSRGGCNISPISSQLPDYRRGLLLVSRGNQRGAPVDADGNPIYYRVPKSYEAAANDGERWRWMLSQAAEFDPSRVNEVDMIFGQFLARPVRRADDGALRLRFGGGDEPSTTARPAPSPCTRSRTTRPSPGWRPASSASSCPTSSTGSRSTQRVADRGKSHLRRTGPRSARQRVRGSPAICQGRRRRGSRPSRSTARAATTIARSGSIRSSATGAGSSRAQAQPAGKKAVVDFRFRNGNKVSFEAHAIKVDQAARRRQGLSQEQSRHSSTGTRSTSATSAIASSSRIRQQYLGDKVAAGTWI